MKRMKRMMALIIVCLLSWMLPIRATGGEGSTTGKITITNTVSGQKYSVYRVFDLISYDQDNEAYVYKINSEWSSAFENETALKSLIYVNSNGEIENAKVLKGEILAERINTYLKSNGGITPTATVTATGDTVEIDNLPLGYYFVDSTQGTVCSLTTNKPGQTINDKNETPSIQLYHLGQKGSDDLVETTEISQQTDLPIRMAVYISMVKGAENYQLNLSSSDGLQIDKDSIQVLYPCTFINSVYSKGPVLSSGAYTITQSSVTPSAVSVTMNHDQLPENQTYTSYGIVVYFNAEFTESQHIEAGTAETVSAYLTYGDDSVPQNTLTETENVYIADVTIKNVDEDEKSKMLSGGKFVLLNDDKNKVAVMENGLITSWTTIPSGDYDQNSIITVGSDGTAKIKGIPMEKVYLKQIKAPDGYFLKSTDSLIALDENTLFAVTTDEGTGEQTVTYSSPTKTVSNTKGFMMPETGGSGTLIFFVSGLFITAIALFLLKTGEKTE